MKSSYFPIAFLLVSVPVFAELSENEIYTQAAAEHVREALRGGGATPSTKGEFVSSAAVAEAIHLAVAGSVFGDEKVQRQRPFRAVRSGDFWVVFGSLPVGTIGGTAVTVLRAINGEVLRVIHEQ